MTNPIKRTPLVEIKGFPFKAFVKDESVNPYGTIKDRRNFQIFEEANRLKVDKLVLITSGNNGYSLAQFAKDSAIKVVCVVNRNMPEETKETLREVAYQVIELNLDHKILRPEELIAFAREKDDEVIWDVTNGYKEHYLPIVDEIFRDITPDYIVVPVGSGGIFLGAAQALERYKNKTKIIGIGVQNTIHSNADKLSTPWTPYTKAIETYQKFGHFLFRLTEQEIKDTYQKFQHTVNCEPSSSVVFAAPTKIKFKKDDIVVFINSGKSKTN